MRLNKAGFGAYGVRLLGPMPEHPGCQRQGKTSHQYKRPELVPDHDHVGALQKYIP
jgi:hypothetical protein